MHFFQLLNLYDVKESEYDMVMSGAQLCCPDHLLSRFFGYEMGEPISKKTVEGESVRGGTGGLHQDSVQDK